MKLCPKKLVKDYERAQPLAARWKPPGAFLILDTTEVSLI
jgi:hypothetical protein